MEKNAILFSNIDKEDYWITGGICFRVKNTETYEDAINEIKEKLEDPRLIEYIIEEKHLLNDLFENDKTYKFKEVSYKKFKLCYEFENESGNILQHYFILNL